MKILHRDDMHHGGFAGLREHRFIMDKRVFGHHQEKGTINGIGNLIYLADARFNPHGETKMHGHKEVDVVSVMVEGEISHAGSLEHGERLQSGDVQIQRAGGEGFSHNEINPHNEKNRMIQIWFAPPRSGDKAGYQTIKQNDQKVSHVYGGGEGQGTFDNPTHMQVVQLQKGDLYTLDKAFQAYLIEGQLTSNSYTLKDGDLFEDDTLNITAQVASKLIVVYLA
jgi:quercetin 2,3-dioxygenase